jgi:hypothetical protein
VSLRARPPARRAVPLPPVPGSGQGVDERAGRLEAIRGPQRQGSDEYLLDGSRQSVEPLTVVGQCVHEPPEAGGVLRDPETGRVAHEQLVDDAGQTEDVGTRVELAHACRLLGTHVARSAESESGSGEPGAARRVHGPRDAEVGDHRVPLGEEDVLRLDVAVDDAAPVGVGQRIRDGHGDRQGVLDGHRVPAVEQRAQRAALEVGHHVVEERIRRARVVQRNDVRMGETGRNLDLRQEAPTPERGGQLGLEHLHRDVAAMPEILRQVDGGHAATPDRPVQPVAIGQRGGQRFGDGGHARGAIHSRGRNCEPRPGRSRKAGKAGSGGRRLLLLLQPLFRDDVDDGLNQLLTRRVDLLLPRHSTLEWLELLAIHHGLLEIAQPFVDAGQILLANARGHGPGLLVE